jgi:general secretion pathway protein I
MRRTHGFTLIEVLVALAIAAIGLAAVLSVVTNSARNAVYLRDKIVASWIAQNRITELRLGTTMPSVDKTSGDVEFADEKWKWEQVVTQTEVAGMRRIDVSVHRPDAPADSALATVTGFVGRVQLSAPPSATSWDILGSGAGAPGTTGAPSSGGTPAIPAPTAPTPSAPPATTTEPGG